jgi:3-oxo-5-alpha-steroid 4-dehydrogenase 1
MTEALFYHWFLLGWSGLAVVVFVLLFFITAPYGRFTRAGFGPVLGQRLGWVLMETPSALLMIVFFLAGNRLENPVAISFLLLWEMHYLHRAFVYPFQLQGNKKKMTLATVLMGIAFNSGNGYLNGRYLFYLAPVQTTAWLADPRFILGVLIFATGFCINKHADAVLRSLRKNSADDYGIPRGGLFERVSSANHFGELLQWIGWAVLTWSPGGLVFALWTAANLVPRARAVHSWYQKRFPAYPKTRKAIIPFLF